jgi:hypothetical protein
MQPGMRLGSGNPWSIRLTFQNKCLWNSLLKDAGKRAKTTGSFDSAKPARAAPMAMKRLGDRG